MRVVVWLSSLQSAMRASLNIQTKQTLKNTYSEFAYCTNVQHRMRFWHFSQRKFSCTCALAPLLLRPRFVLRLTTRSCRLANISSSVLVQQFWLPQRASKSEQEHNIVCRSSENKIKRLLFRIWRHVICTSGDRNGPRYRRRRRNRRKKNKLKYSRYFVNKYLQIPLQQHGAHTQCTQNSEIFQ